MKKHPKHICRFNDPPQECDCFDAGYEKGLADNQKKGDAYRRGYMAGVGEEGINCQKHCEQARKEDRNKIMKGIGALRQWLNEDKITNPERMVNNSELMLWLLGTNNK